MFILKVCKLYRLVFKCNYVDLALNLPETNIETFYIAVNGEIESKVKHCISLTKYSTKLSLYFFTTTRYNT